MIIDSDEDRQMAYKRSAKMHIKALRSRLEYLEAQDPDYFMNDPCWFETYLQYCLARHIEVGPMAYYIEEAGDA